MRWSRKPSRVPANAASSSGSETAAHSSASGVVSLRTASLYVAAATLETLPFAAWFASFAAITSPEFLRPAAPWWLLCAFVLAAAMIATQIAEPGRLRPLFATLFVGCLLGGFVVLLRVSPAAYAGIPPVAPFSLGWMAQIPRDFIPPPPYRPFGAFGLLCVYVWLWLRGLRLGSAGPSYDHTALVFRVGLIAMVFAAIGVAFAPAQHQAVASVTMIIMLPAYVAVGLVAMALSHIEDYVREQRASMEVGSAAVGQSRWLLTAIGLSLLVVGGAFLLAVVFSYDTVLALLSALHPVLDALGTLATWLAEALARVLYFILNGPLTWFESTLHFNSSGPGLQYNGNTDHPHAQNHNALPQPWLIAGYAVLVVAVVIVATVLFVRALRRYALLRRAQRYDETREALDARGMMLDQLRGVLSGLLPRRGGEHETLLRDSVRRRYRDMLRAAQRAGLGRAAAETPGEYSQRQAESAARRATVAGGEAAGALPADALARLTQRYESVRYGDVPEEQADEAAAREESRVLVDWMQRQRG